MRLRWLSVMLVLLTLFLSALPAQAAIIPIRPGQAPKITPSQADFDKIVRLQGITNITALTEVSPDDQSLLIVHQKPGSQAQFEFINVQDGTTRPVSSDILRLAPVSNMVWWDNDTVAYFSFDSSARTAADFKVMVEVDRISGKLTKTPVKLPGIPISFSPDVSKALMVGISLDELPFDSAGDNQFHSPFDQVIQRGFGPTRTDQAVGEETSLDGWLKNLNQAERRKLSGLGLEDLDLLVSSVTVTLLAMNMETGKILPLGDLPPRSDLASIAWSADSSQLAISHITLSDSAPGGSLLSDIAVQDSLGNFTSDKNPFLQGNSVDTVDFKAEQVTKGFLKAALGNGDLFTTLAWNSDGTILAAHMEKPAVLAGRANPVYLYPERSYIRFYSPAGKLLSTLDKPEIEDPQESVPTFIGPDELLVNAIRGMSARFYYYNLTSGEFRALPIEDGTATVMRPTNHSRQLVFGFASFTQAPELMRINLDGQALYRLTFLNEDLSRYGRVKADPVSFTLANGQVRTGYLLQAPGAAFPPANQRMVVWQEGGPTSPMLNTWGAVVERPYNLLPHFGLSVLVVPLPGRLGFGPAFLNGLADNANFGQIDIDEQAEIVRQAISRNYTQPGSVGITGCSYGGYFASQSIVRYPDLYSAANSQCSLLDLFNEWQFGYTPLISYLEGRSPTAGGAAEYLKDSPLYHASSITTPLLLFDGLHDFLPVEASANFHDQVKANGAAVNLLVFTNAGHGLSTAADEIIAAQAQIAWFQQFLQNPAPTTPAPTGLNLWEKLSLALRE